MYYVDLVVDVDFDGIVFVVWYMCLLCVDGFFCVVYCDGVSVFGDFDFFVEIDVVMVLVCCIDGDGWFDEIFFVVFYKGDDDFCYDCFLIV